MGFFLHKVDGSNRPQSLDYLPCAAITPKVGMLLKWSSGNLTTCTGATDQPIYVSMTQRSAACTAGDPIAVLKINPDMVFEVPLQETGDSNTIPGNTVGIYSDGLQATKYNASGKAVIVAMSGGTGTSAAAGDLLYVRFKSV